MALLLTLTSDLDLDDDQVMTQVVGSAGLTIGRGLDNDWIIKDPRRLLSKHHCRVDASGSTFIITDTSTNGVFVNESPTPLGRGNTAVVGDGDRLRLGELDVVVQAIPEADAAALAGGAADPFAAEVKSFAPPSGGMIPDSGADDPWGGWDPPGGRGEADASGAESSRSLAPLGGSLPAFPPEHESDAPIGPMPSGDRLFGRAPGDAAGPWGDDRGWDWSAQGADADNAAPEAQAFVPDAVPALADEVAAGDGGGAEDDVGEARSPVIPEDWDETGTENGDEAGGLEVPSPDGLLGRDPAVPAGDEDAVGRNGASAGPVAPIPDDFDPAALMTDAVATEPGLDRDTVLAVLDECLETFDPVSIMAGIPSLGDPDAMPPAVRQARAWAIYETRFTDLRQTARRRLADALGIVLPKETS